MALFVLYTVLGCLVESIGMIVITVPLIYPVLAKYGIDPIWFGVILVMYRRARPDLAADRHQPVRHSEHLGRRTERRGPGHDPVPCHHVRRPRARHLLAGPRAWLPHHVSGEENRPNAAQHDGEY